MKDLTIALKNSPGALAQMGEVLGRAGVSIEGGGAWVADGHGIGHFLFEDGAAAREALEAAGIRVLDEREVLVQRLNQAEPGQLGKLTRRMADAGVNIETLYSDHDHRMILTVSEMAGGVAVSREWERERLTRSASIETTTMLKNHHYKVQIEWTGNNGEGTRSYHSYRRDYNIASHGKPEIAGSSDPAFRGDATRYNPEELLVASLSSCHMLWYLHLCSAKGVVVTAYRDNASGVMQEGSDGSGVFSKVTLRPSVTISDPGNAEQALALHHDAHKMCYIARSVNFCVEVEPELVSV